MLNCTGLRGRMAIRGAGVALHRLLLILTHGVALRLFSHGVENILVEQTLLSSAAASDVCNGRSS